MVYHRSADSLNSVNEMPIAIFSDFDWATQFASAQKGYGLGVDWFVKSMPLDPPIVQLTR